MKKRFVTDIELKAFAEIFGVGVEKLIELFRNTENREIESLSLFNKIKSLVKRTHQAKSS